MLSLSADVRLSCPRLSCLLISIVIVVIRAAVFKLTFVILGLFSCPVRVFSRVHSGYLSFALLQWWLPLCSEANSRANGSMVNWVMNLLAKGNQLQPRIASKECRELSVTLVICYSLYLRHLWILAIFYNLQCVPSEFVVTKIELLSGWYTFVWLPESWFIMDYITLFHACCFIVIIKCQPCVYSFLCSTCSYQYIKKKNSTNAALSHMSVLTYILCA